MAAGPCERFCWPIVFVVVAGILRGQPLVTPESCCRVPAADVQARVKAQFGERFSVVETDHLRLISDCSPRCRKIMAGSGELFFREFKGKFLKADMKPVTVYYLDRQQGFEEFMVKRGHADAKDAWAIYYPGERAVYAYRLHHDGTDTGIGTLFTVLVDPAVDADFPKNVPMWFAESLSALFQQARFVEGRLRFGCPQPRRAARLRELFEAKKNRPSLERFLSQTDDAFAKNESGTAVGRTVFTFLQSLGEDKLLKFVDLVRQKKPGTSAIQTATGKKLNDLEKSWWQHVETFSIAADWPARAEGSAADRLAILEEGAAKFPRYGMVLGMLAHEYLKLKRDDEARQKALAAIEDPLFNRVHESYQVLGACEFVKDPTQAIAWYRKALAEQPWHEQILGPCHTNLAKLLEAGREKDEAGEVRAQLARLQEEDKLPGG